MPLHAGISRNSFSHRSTTSRAAARMRRSRSRRLSFQTIFSKDAAAVVEHNPNARNFQTLPRSFAAYAHEYAATASKYYDDDAFQPPELPVTPSPVDEPFLLDDDPFADLSGGPKVDTPPQSPLSPSEPIHLPPVAPVVHPRTTPANTTPAYQKPAFRPRPSLPSLSTLAQMNLVVPNKVRRGRVGAGLPHEPWDESSLLTPSSPSTPLASLSPSSPVAVPASAVEPLSPMSTPTPLSPLRSLSSPPTPSRGETFLDLSDHSSDEDQPSISPKSPSWSSTHKAAPSLALAPLEAAGLFLLHPEPVLVSSPRAMSPPLPLPPPPVPTKSPELLPLKELDALDLSSPLEDVPEEQEQRDDGGAAYAALAAGGFGLFVAQREEEEEHSVTRSMSIKLAASHSSASSENEEAPELSFTHSSSEIATEPETYFSPTLSREASASSLASSSSGSEGPEESQIRIRRRFRKSSLFGDLLRFAPASPGAPGSIWGGEMRLATNDDTLQLGLRRVDDMEMEMEMGEDGAAYHADEDDYDMLTPEDLDSALNRASILSTANELGHDVPQGVAFPAYDEYSYSSPPYSTPHLTRSPSSVRSPASSEGDEHVPSWAFGRLREHMSGPSSDGEEADFGGFKRSVPPPPTPASGYSEDELNRSFLFPPRERRLLEVEAEEVEPGTSAGTIRASAQRGRTSVSAIGDPGYWGEDKPVDGSGWEGPSGSGGGGYGRGNGSSDGRSRSTGRGEYGSYNGNGSGSGGWAGRGDDGDDERRPRGSSFSTPTSSESDNDESSEDDYGEPVPPPAAATSADPNSDDDVPLAQRIPSALKAQRTIRRKVREEREERRRDREAGRARQTTLRPAGAANGAQSPLEVVSSSREAARTAEAATLQRTRTRTQTLPGNGSGSAAVDDLTLKLQNMQSTQAERQRSLTINSATSGGRERLPSPSPGPRMASASPPSHHLPLPEAARGLRPQRSFHRPSTAGATSPTALHEPLPADAEARVKRSATTRRPAADDSRLQRPSTAGATSPTALHEPLPVDAVKRSATTRRPAADDSRLQRSTTRARAEPGPAFLSDVPTSPIPPSAPAPNKLTKAPTEKRTPRPSAEMPRPSGEHQPSKSQGTLTRVFVGDMQRFNMVDIGPTTTAKQVLAAVEEQGSLKGWVGTGGWMVWEVAQDFGMERPIRSFEQLADVQASWNKDKMVNMFVIKLTPLAPILSRSNMPSSSPMFSGYVEWEMKRGKWVKRYLRLREHSLFLCKRDNGKDEVFLCSLSNFDAYNVTRLTKAPKPFVFAVKSTDNLSFFENTSDYLHVFACNPRDGDKWVEKILLARSYVLHQERTILFNKSAGGNTAGGSGLSRANTRAGNAGTPQRTGPPPLLTAPGRDDVFLPGSLLRDS